MQYRLIFLLGILSLNFRPNLSAHRSFADLEARIFYHCSEEVYTQSDAEGRGGFAAVLQYFQQNVEELDPTRGKAFLLLPEAPKNLPIFWEVTFWKGNQDLWMGPVRFGIRTPKDLLEEKKPEDFEAFFLLGPSTETGVRETKGTPSFYFQETYGKASFQYLGTDYLLQCPKESGKLGQLHLWFRGRTLVRMDARVVDINLKTRSRSFQIPRDRSIEKDLPKPNLNTKDRYQPKDKADNLSSLPGNVYDREISKTRKDSVTTP